MSSSIAQNIEALCQEQGIERDLVVEAMKEAVRAAAKKQFKSGEDIQVDWNPETGIELSASKVVVGDVTDAATEVSIDEARELAGDEVEIGDALLLPLPMEELGRIAAQTAKQILFQKVRDAVRSNVYEQYIDKIGDLVNGYVKRFERGNIIVDLGNLEAILPRSQQSRGEQWNQGERIRVVINNVSKESKGPQIEVSRTSPDLLKRLFEMEVPEIYDGTVVVKAAVREPGERAKIAVISNERDVDPVGACVGMKGSRVQSIIRELRGEKIDIIPWNDDVVTFAQNSLAPAKITRVSVTSDENAHRPHLDVIVDNDQLSLAIGKRGLNVRLAAELIGAKIDIKSEEEVKGEVADALSAMLQEAMAETRAQVNVHDVDEMPAEWANKLEAAGYDDLDSILNCSVEDLTAIEGIDGDAAAKIIELATRHEEVQEQPEEQPEEPEEGAAGSETQEEAQVE